MRKDGERSSTYMYVNVEKWVEEDWGLGKVAGQEGFELCLREEWKLLCNSTISRYDKF